MAVRMRLSAVLEKVRAKHRDGLLVQWAWDRLTKGLSRVGIALEISITYREGMAVVLEPAPRLTDFTWGIATRAELPGLVDARANEGSRAEFAERIERGAKCYFVRHHDRIVAYIWSEVHGPARPRFGLSFGPRDAYVFDAFAVSSYRGMNVLPFLKYHVLEDLRKQGCETVLSSTDIFNRAAQRYKQKLGARPIAAHFYIGFLGRFEKLFTVYRFPARRPGLGERAQTS